MPKTFVKHFLCYPDSKYAHKKMPLDEQINGFLAENQDRGKLEIKQVTFNSIHMSFTTEALVVFERFIGNMSGKGVEVG